MHHAAEIGSNVKVFNIVDGLLKKSEEARGQPAPNSAPSNLLKVKKAKVALHHVIKWKRKELEVATAARISLETFCMIGFHQL